mmetsp:Transcript_71798/g.126785  ORF Transcript_71798/g.126785 Transcript_71798/m.126785 type:complete len:146 (-) Transcript_71798:16-453(-)
MPTMYPLPQRRARTPQSAVGRRLQSGAFPLSSTARATMALEPKMVPLIVCGRRNFQNARKGPAVESLPPITPPSTVVVALIGTWMRPVVEWLTCEGCSPHCRGAKGADKLLKAEYPIRFANPKTRTLARLLEASRMALSFQFLLM